MDPITAPACPGCSHELKDLSGLLVCDRCSLAFPKQPILALHLNGREARQEAGRLAEVIQPGRILVYQNPILARELLTRLKGSELIGNPAEMRKGLDLELIHAAFPGFGPDRWTDWAEQASDSLGENGALRLMAYHGSSKSVQKRRDRLCPALTKDFTVSLLEKAGFRTILFDRRPARVAARIFVEPDGSFMKTLPARIPAWVMSRFSEGPVLTLLAWK